MFSEEEESNERGRARVRPPGYLASGLKVNKTKYDHSYSRDEQDLDSEVEFHLSERQKRELKAWEEVEQASNGGARPKQRESLLGRDHKRVREVDSDETEDYACGVVGSGEEVPRTMVAKDRGLYEQTKRDTLRSISRDSRLSGLSMESGETDHYALPERENVKKVQPISHEVVRDWFEGLNLEETKAPKEVRFGKGILHENGRPRRKKSSRKGDKSGRRRRRSRNRDSSTQSSDSESDGEESGRSSSCSSPATSDSEESEVREPSRDEMMDAMMRAWARGDAERQSIRVQPFHGSEKDSWREWKKNFERILKNKKFHRDDKRSAIMFSENIRDEALTYYNSLRRKEQNSWALTKNRFEDRFGLKQAKLSGKRDLVALKLKPGETAACFMQKFCNAMEKTYPGMRLDMEEKNDIVIELFFCSLNSNAAYEFIMGRKHNTLAQVSKSLQYFLEMEAGRNNAVLNTCMGKCDTPITEVEEPEKRKKVKKGQQVDQSDQVKELKAQVAVLASKLEKHGNVSQGNSPSNPSKDGKRGGSFKSRENIVGSKAWIIKNNVMPIPNQQVRNACWYCGKEGHNCLFCEDFWGPGDNYYKRNNKTREPVVNRQEN
jgi:hypothetical protein